MICFQMMYKSVFYRTSVFAILPLNGRVSFVGQYIHVSLQCIAKAFPIMYMIFQMPCLTIVFAVVETSTHSTYQTLV